MHRMRTRMQIGGRAMHPNIPTEGSIRTAFLFFIRDESVGKVFEFSKVEIDARICGLEIHSQIRRFLSSFLFEVHHSVRKKLYRRRNENENLFVFRDENEI